MIVYFIEYKNSIKFFGNNNGTIEIPKNQKTYKAIMKLKKDKRIKLVSLI